MDCQIEEVQKQKHDNSQTAKGQIVQTSRHSSPQQGKVLGCGKIQTLKKNRTLS